MKKFIDQVYKAFRILIHKDTSLRHLFKKGSSLSSLEILLNLKNFAPDIRTAVDVGANQGQFAIAASDVYPHSKIYSFEPLPDVVKVFKKNTKSCENITIFQTAIGSNSGTVTINFNNYSHASSILKIHKNQTEMIPETANYVDLVVPLNTLDNYESEMDLINPVVLKLDVQGFEKEVLMGAGNILKKVDYIIIESSFIPMYENELLFDDVNEYMKSIGFRIKAPLAIFQLSNLQILQMDILYIKK